MGADVMPQFDVYTTVYVGAPMVLDIQSDLLRVLKTRVVIPLERSADFVDPQLTRLHPNLEIKGERYFLNTAEMTAVEVSDLHQLVYSLGDTYRQTIIEAVDFVVHGY
jgi:toxin CcdB